MRKSFFIFKRTTALLFLALPFLTLVLFSFSVPDASRVTAKVKYTGEQLFQGIYFHRGDVVRELSTISKTTVLNNMSDQDKGYLGLKSRLLQTDPDFFEHFKEGILSHSHVTVSETLKETSTVIFHLMQSIAKETVNKKELSLRESITSEDACVRLPVPVVIIPPPDIVESQTVSPVLTYSYTVVMNLPLGPPILPLDKNGKKVTEISSQTRLSGEMLVNEIVTKL